MRASPLRPAVFAPCLALAGGLVSLWFANQGAPNPDEGAVLTAASRMLRGDVFYRDLDAYWMPAAAWLLAAVSRLAGEHLSVARALAGGLYVATLLALYAGALELLDRRRAALFGASLLAFKFLAWPAFTAYLYSDFAFCFACIAIALLLRHPRRGARRALVAAGACTTAALLSKQNVGIYLGAAALGLLAVPGSPLGGPGRSPRERRADAWAYAAGACALGLPVLAYFALRGVLPEMIQSALVRPFTGYVGTSSIPFSVPLRWWELGALRGNDAIPYMPFRLWHMLMQGQLPGWDHYLAYWTAAEYASRALYTSLPLAFALVPLHAWRARRHGEEGAGAGRRVAAAATLAGAVVVSAFPRADWFHVSNVYPLVLLLWFSLAQPHPRGAARRPWLAALGVSGVLALCGMLAGQSFVYLTHRIELERAAFWVAPDDAWIQPVVEGIRDAVAPDEPFFVLGHEAFYYFLADRFSPWRFAPLPPGRVGGDRGVALARLLERDRPRVVVRGLERWHGVPSLSDYAPHLLEWADAKLEPDAGFFEEHPPAVGGPPPEWVLEVLRPAARAGARDEGPPP